ncbi:MAG: transporter substrate-binding domain-containing protein [Spartobacteria bacterium]|nr:transporter substrate-binding domain-containing protein [Spartobacteria bacterium]
MKNGLYYIFLGILALFVTGCRGKSDVGADGDKTGKTDVIRAEPAAFVDLGDLDAIKKRGLIRVLVHAESESYLPRAGFPLDHDKKLAEGFARELNLELQYIPVARFEDLIPALSAGKGDVIAANLTVTDDRARWLEFTVPVEHSREQLVLPAARNVPAIKMADLAGKTLAVPAGTTFLETARVLQQSAPELQIVTLPGEMHPEAVFDGLVRGDFDMTIEDSNLLYVMRQYREDITPVMDLTGERALAWAVRPDNPQLLTALNRFLAAAQLLRPKQATYTEDWPGIKKRKTIRFLTRNNAATYFIWRGQLLGFEFELASEFARQHDLNIEVIVAPSHADLIPMLLEGKGDVIASFMTISDQRRARGIAFTRPYHQASEVLVAPTDAQGLNTPEDLAGRYVAVRRDSSYWNTLNRLQQAGLNVKMLEAPGTMETEELIQRVGAGQLALTVADSHLLDIELTVSDAIKSAFPLGPPIDHGWAVRVNDKELLAQLDTFLGEQYRGLFYNITYKKYFKNSRKIKAFKEERPDLGPDGRISPYDDIIKRDADMYHMDWRLIAAQMYQESRFDPKATSWSGAKGLMQLMPRTAAEMGYHNLEDPATGTRAGVEYLDKMRSKFSVNMDERERMWMALASYNAGLGHVLDARRLATQLKLDPDRWFDHVEKAMLLLARPEYAAKARHGYVRGTEPVQYVRNIRDRYEAYAQLAPP